MQPTARGQAVPHSEKHFWNGPYVLRRWIYFWAALVGIAWFTPDSFGILLCGGIALHSLRGTRQSVEALGIIAFLLILGKTDVSLGRWLVLFAAFGRMVWDGLLGGQPRSRLTYPLLLFFTTILLFSVLRSPFPLVSGLKVTTFTLGAMVTVTGFYRTRHLKEYWLSWLFTLGVFILLASIPLYGLGAGYAKNDTGFQGILVHPQTFGPVLAPITALLTGLYFLRQRTSWIVLICMGLGWAGMYFSLSRTSILAVLLAAAVMAAIGFTLKANTWAVDLGRALGRPLVMIGMLVVLSMGVLQWTNVQSKLESFLAKDDGGTSLTESLEASRGGLMDKSMANFWDQPLTGIGFGVPSDPEQFDKNLERGPYGIPLSASVEKGFMPTAVLEETGIIGAGLTILLLVVLFIPTIGHPDPTLFWVMATCLLVNFGEMVFFSMGGMGFFFWIVMGFCHAAALTAQDPRPVPRPVAQGRRPVYTRQPQRVR